MTKMMTTLLGTSAAMTLALCTSAAQAATMQSVYQGTVLDLPPPANGTIQNADQANLFGFGTNADLTNKSVTITYVWSTDPTRGQVQAVGETGDITNNWVAAETTSPFESVKIEIGGSAVSFDSTNSTTNGTAGPVSFSEGRRNLGSPNQAGYYLLTQAEGRSNTGTYFGVSAGSISVPGTNIPFVLESPFSLATDLVSDSGGARFESNQTEAVFDFFVAWSVSSIVVSQLDAIGGGTGGGGSGGGSGGGGTTPPVSDVPLPAALPLLASAIGLFGFASSRRGKRN
jgi:hypothetical protein